MGRPNILVVMCDQMKATASHLYGNSFCQTASMERLASEGVLFQNAITPHPLCAPARVSFWTSQFPHSHGGRRNQTLMPVRAIHAFEIWKEAGFCTGLIGKNHCFEQPDDTNLFDGWYDLDQREGGDELEGWFRSADGIRSVQEAKKKMPQQSPRFSYSVTNYPVEDYSTGLIAGQTIRFIESHRDEPFALWVSFPDPHEPWDCPEQYAAKYPPEKIELPPWRDGEFTDRTVPERNQVLYRIMGMDEDPMDDILGVMGVYYGMVSFLDDGLGIILNALERLELREKTIVVFCSDHGDFMGEHRMICKGGVFYDCLTRVPLIVSWPGGIPRGLTDDSMVNLIDVVPTLLQLQGLDVPKSMQGEGLPTVTNSLPRDVAFSEYGAGGPPFCLSDLEQMPKPYGRRALMASLWDREAEGRRKMVRTRDWKYVHDPMGDRDELYDLLNDPWELTNVAYNMENSSLIGEMRLKLADWSIRTEDSKPVPLPKVQT